MSRGILCGADERQAWLLPWWWSRYTAAQNTYPVTFCDFGLSRASRAWCAERGEVVNVEAPRSVNSERVPATVRKEWEKLYGPTIWEARGVWFRKPAALLKTPYLKTLWIDLDCEILGALEPLFQFCEGAMFSIAREWDTLHLPADHPQAKYNSGVIVYDKRAPLLHLWQKRAADSRDRFWGDDPLLSSLIQEGHPVHEFSPLWNWRMKDGLRWEAQIYHWVGEWGKEYIRQWGGIKPTYERWMAQNHR